MTFEELFIESKGQPIIHKGNELRMVDRIKLTDNEVSIKLTFVSTDSNWNQGIVLQTKGDFLINGKTCPHKIVLWEHTAPIEIQLVVKSQDRLLVIYNVWEVDGTVHYWHNGAAMYIKENKGDRIYYCNDGYADEDLNDLIFKVEFTHSL